MIDGLLAYLLKSSESFPEAKFYESDLTRISASEFARLKKHRYLVFDQYDFEKESYFDKRGNERFVRKVNGKWVATATDDPELSPIYLAEKDLIRYSFGVQPFLAEIKAQNNLYKNSDMVSTRVFFIGAKDVLRERVGVYIGLFADEEQAGSELLSLKARTDQYHKYYVICPTYEIKSHDLLSRLLAEGITCLSFRECFAGSGYAIDFCKLKDKGGLPATLKTNEQISESTAYDYKCEDKIHIPALWPMKRSNTVEINNSPIRLADSLFKLFLRLVVGAKLNKKGGWVKFKIMPGEHQRFSNLRAPLKGALISKNGEAFIESDGKMRYRVSTHPDNISYNREALLDHPSSRIKALAKKIPK